jgi:hypothetical protein
VNTGIGGGSTRSICTWRLCLRSEGVAELGTSCCDARTDFGVKIGRDDENCCREEVIVCRGGAQMEEVMGSSARGRSSWA